MLIVLSSSDAESACRTWRGLSQGYAFVVCSAEGAAKEAGATPDFAATEKTLRTALHALRRTFGNYISPGSVVVAGLDSAAPLAVSLVKQEPAYFARVVLENGGLSDWSSGIATIFARKGGKRALFVCTRPGCGAAAQDAAVLSQRAGAKARSVQREDAGATPPPLHAAFAWLVEDDTAWKPPHRAPR